MESRQSDEHERITALMNSYREVFQSELFWNQIYPNSEDTQHSLHSIRVLINEGNIDKWVTCQDLAKGKGGGIVFSFLNPEAKTIYSRIQNGESLNNKDKAFFAERYFVVWGILYNSTKHSPEKVDELLKIAMKLCAPDQKMWMKKQAKQITNSSQKKKKVIWTSSSLYSSVNPVNPLNEQKDKKLNINTEPVTKYK